LLEDLLVGLAVERMLRPWPGRRARNHPAARTPPAAAVVTDRRAPAATAPAARRRHRPASAADARRSGLPGRSPRRADRVRPCTGLARCPPAPARLPVPPGRPGE